MMTSEQTAKLDQALAKAQGEFHTVNRDARNPHFRSTYASLAAIWEVVRPALAKHGVTVTQHPIEMAGRTDARLYLETRIAHDGEWMTSVCSVPVAKPDIQGWGAALTYAKRYALTAILGLADDDDDGETAAGRGKESDPIATAKDVKPKPKPIAAKPEPTSDKGKFSPMQQVSNVITYRKLDRELVGRWIRFAFPGVDLKSMPQSMADQIMQVLNKATDQSLEEMLLPPGRP